MKKKVNLYVLDHANNLSPIPKSSTPNLYLVWSGSPDEPESLSRYVHDSLESLTEEYLAWIDSVNSKLAPLFPSRFPDTSIWELSEIAEKSTSRSPQIFEVFKLMALVHFCQKHSITAIIYSGSRYDIFQALKSTCTSNGWAFEGNEIGILNQGLSIFSIIRKLKNDIRFFIVDVIWRFLLIKFDFIRNPSNHKATRFYSNTIVTFFPNIEHAAALKGEFKSSYWGPISQEMSENQGGTNWVLRFTPTGQYSFNNAIQIRNTLNQGKRKNFRFYFLEDFLSLSGIYRAIRTWIRCILNYYLNKKKIFECFQNSKFNAFYFLSSTIFESICGRTALLNCLELEEFDTMISFLGLPLRGIFTSEGQTWERSLVKSWNRHRKLGGQFSSIGYCFCPIYAEDFRLFLSKESQASIEEIGLPDKIAVVGKNSAKLLKHWNHPASRIRIVEAARYLYLVGQKLKYRRNLRSNDRTLLVAAGYLPQEVIDQFSALEASFNSGLSGIYKKIIIKPHPVQRIDHLIPRFKEALPGKLEVEISDRPLEELWETIDVAFFGNSTSALLEGVWLGIPSVSLLPENAFNLNQLGSNFPQLFKSKSTLVEALISPPLVEMTDDFLHINHDLKEWRALFHETSKDVKGINNA